jgi:hypothetical protein
VGILRRFDVRILAPCEEVSPPCQQSPFATEMEINMYYSEQIIYDLDKKEPYQLPKSGTVFAWEGMPKRHTHFIREVAHGYQIFTPKTLAEANDLLMKGYIQPAPIPQSHCWKCMGWESKHNKDGSCFK